MKKLIAVTGIILIGCVCLGAAFAPQQTVETGAAASTDQVENEYIVKAENGKIAIYRTASVRCIRPTRLYRPCRKPTLKGFAQE